MPTVRLALLGAALLLSAALTGCNMVDALGRDIEQAGLWLQDEADQGW